MVTVLGPTLVSHSAPSRRRALYMWEWRLFPHSQQFCFPASAIAAIVVFCGHVNALPRPIYPLGLGVAVVIVKHFPLSPLCMPHTVFSFGFLPLSFFSRRTESALNFYLILSQLRCGCLTRLYSTPLHSTPLHFTVDWSRVPESA